MLKRLLHLLEKNDYSKIKKLLANKKEYDIAEILNELELKDLIITYRLLPKDLATDVFAYLDDDMKLKLITSLTDKEAVNIINELDADDATDLVDEMPAIVVDKLLAKVDAETRKNINHLLKYPDNSAGSVMSVEYLDFKEDISIKDALNKIRTESYDKELFKDIYVINNARQLVGTITIKNILINSEDKLIKDLMRDDNPSVNTLMDQEEVAKIFSNYDLTTLPVVDSENRLVGVITIDDVIDIIQSETTEDIEKMAAIVPTEKPYLKLSVWEIWKSRIPWLLLLMFSATFTGKIIESYEVALSSHIILTSFIPMLMDAGGNAGSQASTTIIRGLSLNNIKFSDFWKILWKEVKVSFFIGIVLGIANFFKLMFLDKIAIEVALVVCITLVITIFISKVVGSTLPLIAKKIGFDPTVMASPFITTIIDAVSLGVYFKIAVTLLKL